MECRKFKQEVEMMLPGDISELSAPLKEHAGVCEACAVYLAELAGLNEMLATQQFRVRPGELDDIDFEKIESLAREKASRKTPWPRLLTGLRRWAWAPAVAAALLFLMLIVPGVFRGPSDSNMPDADSYIYSGGQLENSIVASDSLGAELLSSLVTDSDDFDKAMEELTRESDINGLLNDMSISELKALYEKIDNLKG